jgi:hypothetical protein
MDPMHSIANFSIGTDANTAVEVESAWAETRIVDPVDLLRPIS